MISYNDNQTYLSRFIKESFGDVQRNAVRAANYAGILEDDYDDYIIIMIDGYYNIVKVLDDNYPLELDNTVYPFDAKRIYPMQRVKQEIRYTTEY